MPATAPTSGVRDGGYPAISPAAKTAGVAADAIPPISAGTPSRKPSGG
ncbi:MAG TPA: hypothetical protein PL039_04095 [Kiritimatiellia bacterium]|nr:hypothetical protein [Kiritimatiellia bacterium]HQQ60912.1 hypothetical protein [Kiritimatiellia bacterium]